MINPFKKKTVPAHCLIAPVNGQCIALKDVPDPIFSDKIMGDGVAFVYPGDTVYSPCDGFVKLVASTKHAIGLMSDDGIEVLIHVGMDTVNLEGKGFETLVKVKQKVKAGTPLLKINRQFMNEHHIDLMTPMVITNTKNFNIECPCIDQDVEQGQSVVVKTTPLSE